MAKTEVQWISPRDIVRDYGVKYSRIMYLLKNNRIPGAQKVGWGWIIPEESIIQLKQDGLLEGQ